MGVEKVQPKQVPIEIVYTTRFEYELPEGVDDGFIEAKICDQQGLGRNGRPPKSRNNWPGLDVCSYRGTPASSPFIKFSGGDMAMVRRASVCIANTILMKGGIVSW